MRARPIARLYLDGGRQEGGGGLLNFSSRVSFGPIGSLPFEARLPVDRTDCPHCYRALFLLSFNCVHSTRSDACAGFAEKNGD